MIKSKHKNRQLVLSVPKVAVEERRKQTRSVFEKKVKQKEFARANIGRCSDTRIVL